MMINGNPRAARAFRIFTAIISGIIVLGFVLTYLGQLR